MSAKKQMFMSYAIVFVAVVLDQITKFVFTAKSFVILPGVLSVYYSENTGGAWSVLSGKVLLLIILSVVFLSVLIVFSHKFKEKNALYLVAYGFILGGAIGNLIDRVFFGYVRDFIKLDFINYPIFNIADSFLIIGVILFCVFVFFVFPKIEQKNMNNKSGKKN